MKALIFSTLHHRATMPSKEKKTQLKPIARGFATTSQPKKVVANVEDAVELESTNSLLGPDNIRNHTDQVLDGVPSGVASTPETNPDEQSLQNLVDKLQKKKYQGFFGLCLQFFNLILL